MNFNFCVFCWRAVANTRMRSGRTLFFCNIHKSAGNSKSQHERDKRRIISMFEKKKIVLNKSEAKYRYYSQLSSNLLKVTETPTEATVINKYPLPHSGIVKQAQSLYKAISWAYPITFNKLKLALSLQVTNNVELVERIIKSLMNSKDMGIPPITPHHLRTEKDASVWYPLLIQMLARHEAYEKLQEQKMKPGVSKDKELRGIIKALISEYQKKGKRLTQREISRQVGRSEQRVSVLMKEMKLKV